MGFHVTGSFYIIHPFCNMEDDCTTGYTGIIMTDNPHSNVFPIAATILIMSLHPEKCCLPKVGDGLKSLQVHCLYCSLHFWKIGQIWWSKNRRGRVLFFLWINKGWCRSFSVGEGLSINIVSSTDEDWDPQKISTRVTFYN